MPIYNCSYAYDVSCFADFSVAASSQEEANRIIQEALKARRFENVVCPIYWENADNHRAFVQGEATADNTAPPIEQLPACTQM